MEGGARPTFTGSLQRLRSVQKPAKGAPPYSLFVNRPVGRVFAAAAYLIGMTPNQVTGLSAVCSFASIAAVALLPPSGGLGLLVGAGLIIGYALDSADGQLARLRGGGSPAGEWLDHMIDAVKVVAVHLAVLIAWYRHADLLTPRLPESMLLVPIGFAVVSSVHFFGMILVDLMGRLARAQRDEPAPQPQSASMIKTLLKLPTDYGLLCLLFLGWGVPWVFAVGYSAMAVATTGYLLLVVIKWRADVEAMDRSVGPARRASR